MPNAIHTQALLFPVGKLVSPAPDHRKLPLSHLWRVVELTAIHIFGRELAVRPKLGVC